ncbi:MAG TPA: hypothetical protein ENH82_14710 [bacterium]|nr:hypothetical protein [bacterium]
MDSTKKRYAKLEAVLADAYIQATEGKGHERHDDGELIENQHTLRTGRTHPGFLTGQAAKKIEEQAGMDSPERKKQELLGAIIYCAFQIILLDKDINK